MARPRKEGMDYFPHDTDAVNDEKIEALRALFGNDGYAFYFILLERIYRTPSFELNVSDVETIKILSKKILVSEDVFKKMLETSLRLGCFDRISYKKRKVLTSPGIKKRALVVIEKRVAMRSKYQKDYVKQAEVSEVEITPETKEETPQSKGEKSKASIYTLDVSEILSFWNSKNIIVHNEESEQLKNEIAKALKLFSKEEIVQAIERYSTVINSNFYYSHKFGLDNFLKQKNGITNFFDKGQVWVNYINSNQVKNGVRNNEERTRNYELWDDSYIQTIYGTK